MAVGEIADRREDNGDDPENAADAPEQELAILREAPNRCFLRLSPIRPQRLKTRWGTNSPFWTEPVETSVPPQVA